MDQTGSGRESATHAVSSSMTSSKSHGLRLTNCRSDCAADGSWETAVASRRTDFLPGVASSPLR